MPSKGSHPSQAIITRTIPATNTKPTRVLARAAGGMSVYSSWNDAAGIFGSHEAAAIKLCKKLDWHGTLVPGGLKDGYVFTFANHGAKQPVLKTTVRPSAKRRR